MTASAPEHPTRTAVVTGSARGLREAIARRLAADGMRVAVTDLDEAACEQVAASIRDAGGTAVAVRLNVAQEDSVSAGIERITAEIGAPTVLVNNAGILRDGMHHKMSVEDWDAVMHVHLRGAFLMARAVRPHIAAAHWGRVISLSSISALGLLGQLNYSSAKAGLQGFTKTLALELGRFQATANAIAPGFILTEMLQEAAENSGISLDAYLAEAIESIPVRRVGVPEDIAATASFLASDDAGFISGQVLYVAGGPKT